MVSVICDDANFTHVIHIADIHVRIGDHAASRVDEYRCVFNTFCDEISVINAVKNHTALLVIAGDVFHNKGRMDSVAGKLFFEWINRLLSILPIVVICGNHDFRQETPEYTDMIELFTTPYLASSTRFPIYYMRNTGHYVYGNIGFGITSVKDTLRAGNTAGIIDELANYPSPNILRSRPEVTNVVALFHGTITQSALPSGRSIATAKGYSLKWFEGYDIVMLGDNHKQQVHENEGMLWGYPGSLIQQDVGEPLMGHGYLVWDLRTKTATTHHVLNPYGALTLSKCGDQIVVHEDSHLRTTLHDMPYVPPFARVRVIGTYEDQVSIQELLHADNIVPVTIRIAAIHVDAESSSALNGGDDVSRLTDLNNPARWVAFMRSHDSTLDADVDDLLYTPSTMLITCATGLTTDITQSIESRNVKIRKLLDAYDAEVQRSHIQNHNVVFKYMEWDYLMCYGKHNWFDFEQLDGKVALLNGPNASGKSAYMDVVCIALFGQPTASRRDFTGDAMSAKLIYDEKPDRESSYVILQMTVDDVDYEIYRSFTYSSNARARELVQSRIVAVYEIVGSEKFVVAEGVSIVEQWVRQRVGTADEMLMSTMLCQSDTTNFFFRSPSEQHSVLERALHMDTIAAFERVLDEAVRAHKYVLTEITNYHKGLIDASSPPSQNHNININVVESELSNLMIKISELKNKSNALIVSIGPIEDWMRDESAYESAYESAVEDDETRLQHEIEQLADIDTYKIAMIQGELAQRQRALSSADFQDIEHESYDIEDGEHLHEQLSEAQRSLDALMIKQIIRPNQDITEDEFNAWKALQPRDWIDDARLADRERIKFQSKRNKCQTLINRLQNMRVPIPGQERPPSIVNIKNVKKVKHIERGIYELQRFDDALREPPGVVERPVNDPTAVENWNTRWNEWNELGKEGQTATSLTIIVHDIQSRVELMCVELEIEELIAIDFNPKCAACRKQPKWLHLQTLKSKRDSLDFNIDHAKRCDNINMEEMTALLSKTKHQLKMREDYEHRQLEMITEHAEWSKAFLSAEREACRITRTGKIQQQRVALQWRVWDTWREQMHQAQDAWNIADRDYQCVDAFIRELTEKQSTIISWRLWKTWNDDVTATQVIIDQLNTKIQQHSINVSNYEKKARYKNEANALAIDMRAAKTQIEEMNKKNTMVNELKRVRRILSYRMFNIVNRELSQCESIATQQREVVIKYYYDHNFETRQLTIQRHVAAKMSELQTRYNRLRLLQQRFVGDKTSQYKGFKAYVYEECVLPLIQNEVNRFIRSIEPFRLKIQTKNARFIFLLEDRGCTPTLDHASGYQKFIVGLGMRIALSRIQAAGHNVKHLFLDEGFVACDALNLQKTAGMLQEILSYGGYRSMIMMSHLDTIRDAAHVRIGIRRHADNKSSILQWGQRRRTISKSKR